MRFMVCSRHSHTVTHRHDFHVMTETAMSHQYNDRSWFDLHVMDAARISLVVSWNWSQESNACVDINLMAMG